MGSGAIGSARSCISVQGSGDGGFSMVAVESAPAVA